MPSLQEHRAELIEFITECYDKLTAMWNVYGFSEANLDKRNKAVLKHTKDLYDEMLTEEERRLKEKQDEVKGYQDSIAKLSRDLQEGVPEMLATTLMAQCDELIEQEKILKQKKAEKMKEWLLLKQQERALKESLGDYVVGDLEEFDGIPGQTDIDAVKTSLNELTSEKAHRKKDFGKMKDNVKQLLKMLEKSSLSELEKQVMMEETPLLTLSFLALCRELEKKLNSDVEANRVEVEQLNTEIEYLKRLLKDDPNVVTGNSIPSGHTPSALVQIRAEHARLTQHKMSNLENFIAKLRTEIEQLSEVLFMKTEKVLPELVEASEHCLDLHENVLQRLKSYQVEYKNLLAFWRKRQGLWAQWLEYDAKADDPNRFNNRGGALLREEKQKKLLEKSLPKLENEITSLAESCPNFKIFDKSVKDVIAEDWNTFNREKEEKKISKKQQGTNNTMNVTRKRPMTPSACGGTPAGKRGKMMPSTTPTSAKPPATPKRALRSSTSKDNLPSPTYSEFTSHKHIFQSTMNEHQPKGPAASGNKSPGVGKSAPGFRMTPREIKDKF